MKNEHLSGKSRQNREARSRIVQALLELIRKKPLSEISISELTAQAGVSRMTFYRNYSSREDVLLSEIQDILDRYKADDERETGNGTFYDLKHVQHVFSYFYEYREFVDDLLCCGFSDVFLQQLTDFAIQKWMGREEDPLLMFSLTAFVGMMFNCYLQWIQNEEAITLEELSALVAKISEQGL